MRRVVYVVGPTGSGKSRLGIDIARACNGEVINADAMQMYRGLDVACAKVPVPERLGLAHHLLSFLPPSCMMTVRDFRSLASAVIDDVVSRGKLPVVVGGTGYYIQSLLRESLLEEDEQEAREALGGREGGGGGGGGGEGEGGEVHEGSGASGASGAPALHERLSRVDPVMAQRLHPNDTKKLARALQVFESTGVPLSTVLARQAARLAESKSRAEAAAAATGGAADSCHHRVYWLTVDDKKVHNARLDARVDTMLAQGLLEEVKALRSYLQSAAAHPQGGGGLASKDAPSPLTLGVLESYKASTGKAFLPPPGAGAGGAGAEDGSYSGLLQAIGYKEFSEYLGACDAGEGAQAQAAALKRGVERLRVVTHAYARKQDRWVRNRFEKRGIPLVRLDTSALEGDAAAAAAAAAAGGSAGPSWWDRCIGAPVAEDVKAWLLALSSEAGLKGAQLLPTTGAAAAVAVGGVADGGAGVAAAAAPGSAPAAPLQSPNGYAELLDWGGQKNCDACGRLLNGRRAWEAHIASRLHKKRARRAGAGQEAAAEEEVEAGKGGPFKKAAVEGST